MVFNTTFNNNMYIDDCILGVTCIMPSWLSGMNRKLKMYNCNKYSQCYQFRKKIFQASDLVTLKAKIDETEGQKVALEDHIHTLKVKI